VAASGYCNRSWGALSADDKKKENILELFLFSFISAGALRSPFGWGTMLRACRLPVRFSSRSYFSNHLLLPAALCLWGFT
jgi:hypothetical protein